MKFFRILLSIGITFASIGLFAETPALEVPLPLVSISDKGELIPAGDDFDFSPWSSATNPGKVHVLQYFSATMAASKIFKPFTDGISKTIEPGSVHVTTVINLDAAIWGTSGFVISELKKNKRIHPKTTMVVDKEGTGAATWKLGDEGAGLAIMDAQGKVKYFTTQAMTPQELEAALTLLKATIDG
jgi:YtfJ family uncharacterized protein